MTKEIILTKQGLEEMKIELTHLLETVRPNVIKELVEARNQGDLSENADYDAARNRQAQVEARIKEVETIINQATIIEETGSKDEIKIGSTVEYTTSLSNDVIKIKIVGTTEADPFKFQISNESAIAQALLGHRSGDKVDVKEIKEPYLITIKSVK